MMSQYPGPTREAACIEIYNSLQIVGRTYVMKTSNIYLTQVIRKVVFSYKEGELGSQAGWEVFLKDEIEKKVIKIIKEYPKRRNHIITLIRSIGKKQLAIERRYRPEGIFEIKSALLWNPILMGASEADASEDNESDL